MSDTNRAFSNNPSSMIHIDEKKVIRQRLSQEQITFYLPCYVRLLFKELNKVDIDGMEATIKCTLLYSFYHHSLPDDLLEELLRGNEGSCILLEFNHQESIELKVGKECTLKRNREKSIVDFVLRQDFVAKLNGNVFLTPFHILNMDLLVISQTVHINLGNIQYNIKFNHLDNVETRRIKHSNYFSFGYYCISPIGFQTTDTNTRENPYEAEEKEQENVEKEKVEKHNKKGIRAYQYTHFRIPIYKHPGLSILTVFIPIWILGLIGLCVFFQEQGFGARLATIAVLVLAFVAFLPTINSSIPPSPDIKLVDLLILMQIASTILLLVESFTIRDIKDFVFDWQHSRLFLSAFALNSFTIFTVLLLFLIHKFAWQPCYNKKVSNKYQELVIEDWSNYECKRHIYEHANSVLTEHRIQNL